MSRWYVSPPATNPGSCFGSTASLLPLLILVGCAANADEKAPPPPPPEVGFVVVGTQSIPLTTELAGRTAAYETSEVRPQVNGIVLARLFTEGSFVRAGQTLYQIDPSLYEAATAEALANVASARATETGARIRADRLRPLAAMEAVSQQDYTDAQATANSATAAIAQNRATLDTARINLRFTRIAAPISGRIGRSLFTTGALVSAAQTMPLATIQRLDPMFVDIQQSSAELLRLRASLTREGIAPATTQVRLKLADGSDYPLTGTLEFTEVTVDEATGTVTLRARFPNPQGVLLAGMYVRATLAQTRDQDAILVPQQGIARTPRGEATAMVVGPGNKAMLRTVQTGRAVGNMWLVTSGLAVGDRLIVEGLSKARPNAVVRPVPAGSRPKPAPAPAPGAPGAKAG